ncbi:MAG TPA: transposase [Pelotomaculum sp.]|nr:transposase [Pelotomaculum sp.]
MPHLHGFTRTLRYKLLTPTDVKQQMRCTTAHFRQVVSYYLQIFQEHQELIGYSQWLKAAETMTHRTKSNPHPVYPFDHEYSNLPSGFRRAAISEAYGLACAWQSSYEKWQAKKQKLEKKNPQRVAEGQKPVKFKEHPPQYPVESNSWLGYYKTEYKWLDKHHILLKLYTGSTYSYRKVALLQPLTIPPGYATGSPSLIHKPIGWELHIPIVLVEKSGLQEINKLVKTAATKICVVDLGVNRHAAMTIQDTKGRVYATKFISGAQDNHLRKRYLEKIVALQAQTRVIPEGERFAKDIWDKVSNLNNDIAHRVSRQIVNFTKDHKAKIIVFEYLDNLKPEKGTKSHWLNRKLGYWVKGRIFRYTQYKGLHVGIVTSRVSPKNTSARCPYCGFLSIERYTPGKEKGVDLARCTNCGVKGVNADFIGTLGIGLNFRLKHCS